MNIDNALINACANGDRKAQFMLYNESFSALMSIAFRYYNNREDAASITNQCFLKILKGLPNFIHSQSSTAYFVWIRRIMTNTVIDEFRKNTKWKDVTEHHNNEPYLESLSTEEYNCIDERIEKEALYEMLSRLSEIQRSVFNLFAIDGYNHKEIAKALLISESNSKYHLSQARIKLQAELKKQLDNNKSESHV